VVYKTWGIYKAMGIVSLLATCSAHSHQSYNWKDKSCRGEETQSKP
jgi:hypothetical protein